MFFHQLHDVSYITVEGATDFAKDLGIGVSTATELCKRGDYWPAPLIAKLVCAIDFANNKGGV